MPIMLDDNDKNFFKQIEKELWENKYERLKHLENKIKTSTEKSETLPVENAAYQKKEILSALKNEYYKLYTELAKKEKLDT